MVVTSEVKSMFEMLEGPGCTEGSAVGVLAALVKAVWLAPTSDLNKNQLLDQCLRTLISGRDHTVVSRFMRALEAQFALLPLHWAQVRGHIQAWRRLTLVPVTNPEAVLVPLSAG